MRLPPYGRRLMSDPKPASNVFVYCGAEGFSRAATDKRPGPILAIREDDDPSSHDWRLVSGRDAVVIEYGSTNRDRLERIAYYLLVAGAKLVITLPLSREILCYRTKGLSHVA